MITRAKIDEWIRQVEAAPVYAPILIRQITERLLELDALNESLRAENLELSSGNRVRQYETRIAELEFQLDLLKRQLGKGAPTPAKAFCTLILYNDRGQLLRLDMETSAEKPIQTGILARINGNPSLTSYTCSIAAVAPYDQLLLVFSSGRTQTLSVDQITPGAVDDMDWQAAYQVDIRSLEELSYLLPVTRMHLSGQCIQTSRFGYARKFTTQYLNSFISNNHIGKGVKFSFDRILNLVLGNDEQTLVLASHDGSFLSLPVRSLPVALGEILRLKVKDYLVSAFVLAPEQKIVAVTQEGNILLQKSAWLELAEAEKHKARQLGLKPEAGEYLAGAAILKEKDYLAIYWEDGVLSVVDGSSLKSHAALGVGQGSGKVLALTLFAPAQIEKEVI